MAARRKKETPQTSLFGATLTYAAPVAPAPAPASDLAFAPFPPELAPTANEAEPPAPPVRRVERKPDTVVVVQSTNGQFIVERLRDGGTTSAAVFFTRPELEQLAVAVSEALR